MWTEEELPDADLESVYGQKAMAARTMAQLRTLLLRQAAIIRQQEETNRRLDRLLQQQRTPTPPSPPEDREPR